MTELIQDYNKVLNCKNCGTENRYGDMIDLFCSNNCRHLYTNKETPAESLKNVVIEKVFESTEGQKHDDGKLDYTLLPFDALKEVVKVLEFGKKKYERDNWQKVEPKERYLQAAFRHVIAYAQGEKLDEESELSHLAHAICCLLFLIWKEKES